MYSDAVVGQGVVGGGALVLSVEGDGDGGAAHGDGEGVKLGLVEAVGAGGPRQLCHLGVGDARQGDDAGLVELDEDCVAAVGGGAHQQSGGEDIGLGARGDGAVAPVTARAQHGRSGEDGGVGDELPGVHPDPGRVQQPYGSRSLEDGGRPPQPLEPQVRARLVGPRTDRAALRDEVSGAAAGEVVVVEQPHLHAGLLGGLQDVPDDVEPALGEEGGLHLRVVVGEDDDLVQALGPQVRHLRIDEFVRDGPVPVPVHGGPAVAARVGEGGRVEGGGAGVGERDTGQASGEGGGGQRGECDEAASGQGGVLFWHGERLSTEAADWGAC